MAGTIDGPTSTVHDGSGAAWCSATSCPRRRTPHGVGQTGLWVREDALDDDGLSDLRLQPVGVPGGVRSADYALGLTFGQTEITLNDGPDRHRRRRGRPGPHGRRAGGGMAPAAPGSPHRDPRLPARRHPAGERVGGPRLIVSERLLGADRAVGQAYVRAGADHQHAPHRRLPGRRRGDGGARRRRRRPRRPAPRAAGPAVRLGGARRHARSASRRRYARSAASATTSRSTRSCWSTGRCSPRCSARPSRPGPGRRGVTRRRGEYEVRRPVALGVAAALM